MRHGPAALGILAELAATFAPPRSTGTRQRRRRLDKATRIVILSEAKDLLLLAAYAQCRRSQLFFSLIQFRRVPSENFDRHPGDCRSALHRVLHATVLGAAATRSATAGQGERAQRLHTLRGRAKRTILCPR